MAKVFGCAGHNTGIINIDGRNIDEIKVVDEQHPLYGRTFKISFDQADIKKTKLIRVEYKKHIQLLIPITSTNIRNLPKPFLTKLTIGSIKDIILLFKEIKLCPLKKKLKKKVFGKKSQIKPKMKS